MEGKRGPKGGRREGRGRLDKGNTLMDMVHIHKFININSNVMHEESEGTGRELGEAHRGLCACMSLSL